MSKQYSTLDSFNKMQRASMAARAAGVPQKIVFIPNYGGVGFNTSANGTQTPSGVARAAGDASQYAPSSCAGYSTLGGYSCTF